MRRTRVLSYALNPPLEAEDGDRVATNLDLVLRLLDDAEKYDPNFVCFPEFILQLRYRRDGLSRDEVAQPIPGAATDAVAEKAAELGSYVFLPMIQRDGDDLRNAATFIGPTGEIVGIAHKFAPTIGEMNDGTKPGEDVKVWKTEFGRVGACICWDGRYPELGVRFAEKGANLVFHPTTAKSYQHFETWAKYYGYHVVACDKTEARTLTPTGTRLGEITGHMGTPSVNLGDDASAGVSFAIVNTDCGSYGRYQNRETVNAIRERYGGDIAFHELPEVGNIVVESLTDDCSIEDLEAEFEMETMLDYEERTRKRVFEESEQSPLLPPRE
ncbi:carbon-nitrogen hydrolase family protein [Haloprofundus salinisoli]|uniref:carbon-nitrogen hydrolase family protein n=1 Tax=Haloprofundus salinisoli TaxID=2876193 RepID=UPI001CCC0A9B|nr:carbon-nitrogen hydrolase family protein [Haloprofundus salinisoli]